MRYDVCKCECVTRMWYVFLAPNLWRNVKVHGYSIAFTFAFTVIDPWSDPLAAFTFIFAYAFTFGHMEAPQCAYMLFHHLSHSHSTYRCNLSFSRAAFGMWLEKLLSCEVSLRQYWLAFARHRSPPTYSMRRQCNSSIRPFSTRHDAHCADTITVS